MRLITALFIIGLLALPLNAQAGESCQGLAPIAAPSGPEARLQAIAEVEAKLQAEFEAWMEANPEASDEEIDEWWDSHPNPIDPTYGQEQAEIEFEFTDNTQLLLAEFEAWLAENPGATSSEQESWWLIKEASLETDPLAKAFYLWLAENPEASDEEIDAWWEANETCPLGSALGNLDSAPAEPERSLVTRESEIAPGFNRVTGFDPQTQLRVSVICKKRCYVEVKGRGIKKLSAKLKGKRVRAKPKLYRTKAKLSLPRLKKGRYKLKVRVVTTKAHNFKLKFQKP